jgi:hypothetical protein
MLPMEFKDENFVEHTQSHEDGSNQSRNEEDMNFKNKGVILLKNIVFIHFVTFEHTFATLQTIRIINVTLLTLFAKHSKCTTMPFFTILVCLCVVQI